MKYIYPNYYQKFTCIASRCKDNCCIGWEIDIDEETAAYYETVKASLQNALPKVPEVPGSKNAVSSNLQKKAEEEREERSCEAVTELDNSCSWQKALRDFLSLMERGISKPKKGQFCHFILQKDGRCPFLNAENLCEICLKLGEDALSQICTDHPRFYHCYQDREEAGLGLCCEEAARLILFQKEPVSFLETDEQQEIKEQEAKEQESRGVKEDQQEKQQGNRQVEAKEELALAQCLSLRETAYRIIQMRERSIWERLKGLYQFALKLWQDDGSFLSGTLTKDDLLPLLRVHLRMEALSDSRKPFLRNLRDALSELLSEDFRKEYEKADPEAEIRYEQLMMYFLYRYLIEAGEAYPNFEGGCGSPLSPSKNMAVMILSCLSAFFMIYLSELYLWKKKGEKKSLSEEEIIFAAKEYSKETEYSEENMRALRQYAASLLM